MAGVFLDSPCSSPGGVRGARNIRSVYKQGCCLCCFLSGPMLLMQLGTLCVTPSPGSSYPRFHWELQQDQHGGHYPQRRLLCWSLSGLRKCEPEVQQGAKYLTLQSMVGFLPGSGQKAPGIRDRLSCEAPLGVYQPARVQIPRIDVAGARRGQPGCLLPHCPNSIFTQRSPEDSGDLWFVRAVLAVSSPCGLGVEPVGLTPRYLQLSVSRAPRPLLLSKRLFCASSPDR